MGRTSDAKERLLKVAAHLMLEHGYGGFSVEEICRKAEVKKGSFYHFFSSKADLAILVAEQSWQQYQRHVLVPLRSGSPTLEHLVDELFAGDYAYQLANLGAGNRVNGILFSNLLSEFGNMEDALKNKIVAILTDFRTALEEVLRMHDFPALCGKPPADGAKALLACLQGSWLQARLDNRLEVIAELGGFVRGLFKPDRIPSPLESAPPLPTGTIVDKISFVD